jgi:hypothetical protein
MSDVMIRSVAVLAALLFMPPMVMPPMIMPHMANAAELPVPKLHKAQHRLHRVRTAYAAKPHFGYYFGHWGWRWGGTATSWYGSTFVLAGAPGWAGASVVAASPKGIAAIHCPQWRPDVCLAEPILSPVARVGRPGPQ